MRIMEWNLSVGGYRDRLVKLFSSLATHNPEIICFIDFRQERIIELSLALAKSGWPYLQSSQPPQNEDGILIASKRPMESVVRNGWTSMPHRHMEVVPHGSDLNIMAVHVPSVKDIGARMSFWDALIDHGRECINTRRRAIIIGDLSTGLEVDFEGTRYMGEEQFRTLLDLGWRDVWREYRQKGNEYSWYNSQGKGCRLDHVLVTPFIDRPVWAKYSHREREEGLTEHSPLILDIADRLSESGAVQSALR